MTDKLNDIAATAQAEAANHARTCGTWRLVEIVQGLAAIYPTAAQGTPEHLADYTGELHGYYNAALQRGIYGMFPFSDELAQRLLDLSDVLTVRRYGLK